MIAANGHVYMCADPGCHFVRVRPITDDVPQTKNCLILPGSSIAQNSSQCLPIGVNITQYQKTQSFSLVMCDQGSRTRVSAGCSAEAEADGNSLVWSGMASAMDP